MLNPWRYPALAAMIRWISNQLRRRRVEGFLTTLRPGPTDRVLDVGAIPRRRGAAQLGTINPLAQQYPWPDQIVSVGIEQDWELPLTMPYVVGDGCRLPFRDGAVDFVFSNAVIEHVGGPDRASEFLSECWRVARKGIWVSTPNRWFPIEIHTFLPFVHWLPLRIYWWVAGHLYDPHYASPMVHWPLRRADLAAGLPPGCRAMGSGEPWSVQLIVWGRPDTPVGDR